MDSYNFMTFSVDDKVSCIQYFREGQIFVATPNSIKVYDLTLSSIVSQANHSIGQNIKDQEENSKDHLEQGKQAKKKQLKQQDQSLSALEMHYFPNHQESSSKFKQELIQNQGDSSQLTQWKDDSQEKSKILGYLLVHYKMTGLSTYKIQQSLGRQDKPFSFTINQPLIIISFVSFIPVKFGSAFLNLTFLAGIYHETNSKANKEVKKKYLTSQNTTNTQSLQADLKSHMSLTDFVLEDKKKTGQFMIFQNDNELFQIKLITLNHDGLLQINQSFQVDEQSARLNSSTVTALKYFQYRYDTSNKNSSFLIMAMEAGDLLLYQLPYLSTKSPNSEHYLEPIKKLNVKKFLQFRPKKEDLDYSVTSIQLLHQSMAFLLVRNCGILLMNLKDFTIVNQLSLTIAPNKNYFFTDTRLISSIRSNLYINPFGIESSQENQSQLLQIESIKRLTNQKVEISLILANKSSLKNLSIQLTIDKILEQSQHEGRKQFKVIQKVQINKMKCNIIEQLNTPLIENLHIVKHNYSNIFSEDSSNQTNLKTKSLDQEIQVFGNYQLDKIFYFTP